MSINLLKLCRTTNNLYCDTLKLARIWNHSIDNKIYNSKRSYIGQNKKAFEGASCCGPFSYILSYELIKKYPSLDFKEGYASYGYSKHLEDHLCILHDDIIIDPTYKQFLNSAYCDGKSEYSNYLYEQLPPFFVGRRNDLNKMVSDLLNLETKLFGKTSLDKKDLETWWTFEEYSPYKFNLYNLVFDKKYKDTEIKVKGMKELVEYLRLTDGCE